MKRQDYKKQAEEYKELLQRLQAEFENYKKREEKERQIVTECSKIDFIKGLLPILDSFELALKNTENQEKFKKGVELIYAQLYSLLEAEGLKPIKALSEKFDPYKHEVLLQEKCNKDEVVIEELQKGYMLNNIVIRQSKIKLGKKEVSNADICEDPQKRDIKACN